MIEQILNFFFPTDIYCIACGNLIDGTREYALCDSCLREIKWISSDSCKICGKSLGFASAMGDVCFECQETEHQFTKGFSCATYEGPVKEILSGLKYKGRPYYAEKMVKVMSDRSQGFIDDVDLDLILPVPMYKKKERKRGFNQSQLIAKGLSSTLGLDYDPHVLEKNRNTAPMSSLSSGERRINLHNSFSLGYNKKNQIENKNILLIDDVYTTGSTADACASVLKDNGASEVYIFTFAAGVNMKPKAN